MEGTKNGAVDLFCKKNRSGGNKSQPLKSHLIRSFKNGRISDAGREKIPMQLKNKKYTLFFVLTILAAIALAAPASAVGGPPTVHNIDTTEEFYSIQAAIDAENTTAGHTILVDSGIYTGADVTKAVILRGNDTDGGLPVIVPSGIEPKVGFQVPVNNAEIHDFKVQGEGYGIWISSDGNNWIDAVTIDVTGNYDAIYIDEADGNKITGCTFNNGIVGLLLDGCNDNEITDCTFIGAQFDGIALQQSNNNVFTGCTVRDTLSLMLNSGVHVFDSTGNTFEDCSITENQGAGVWVGSSTDITFEDCSMSGNEIGVYLDHTSDTTLTGCTMSDNTATGIYPYYSTNTALTGCTISNNGDYGARLWQTVSTTITGCTVSYNTDAGIFISQEETSVITNNFFQNSQNVNLSLNTDTSIAWNTAKTAGTSIVYGPYLGGNFWATPDGDGWSETQPDADGDGIIDEPYVMEVTVGETTYTYTDYLPLAYVMTAAFSADPTSGTAPLSVQFSDASVGEPTSWAWDFGDGATSSVANPLHRYSSAGVYTVTLTASNAFADDSETRTGYISVGAPDNGGDGGPSETAASVSRGLSGGDNTTFNLDPSKSAFYAIEVTVNGTVKEILVTARDIGSPESSIPALNGTVFQFIEVTLYKTTDDVISSAEIQFSIPIEWFEEQGIDFSDIVLYRWHDGEWEELPTMFVKEEDGKAYFTATSPGFSLFAIIAAKEQVVAGEGEEIPVPTEEPTVEATVTEEPAPGEPLPPETAAPTPEPTQSPLLWAPVAALGALLLMGKRW
jgi:PGF-pre-PGF domain-containing protein